jgi:lipopolysaccharide transport system permease protein
MIVAIGKGMIAGHALGLRLFKRDLKAGFEASMLGYLWTILPSLAAAGLWIFLNHQRVIKVAPTPIPYPAFVLIGTTIWTLFSESLNRPIQRYKTAMSMMVKLNFPREGLALAALYDMLFGMILKLGVLMIILVFLGITPTIYWLLVIPLLVGVVFFGLAIGLFITPFGILFNDIGKGINLILPFLMYLSPVVYPLSSDSFLGKMQVFNPVAPLIEGARAVIAGLPYEMFTPLCIWTGITFLFFALGLLMLRIALPIIVERSGS